MNTSSQPAEFDRRVAVLAVTRFGADRLRVQLACQSLRQAVNSGKVSDLVEHLVVEKILTPTQAGELRRSLETKSAGADRLPPNEPSERTEGPVETTAGSSESRQPAASPLPSGNGQGYFDEPDLLGNDSARPVLPTRSGYFLRSIADYRLLRRIGEGGMGTVYLAYHEAEDRQVAIKVLADQLAANPNFVERFHREAKSGALFNHPNIVRSLAAGKDRQSGKHYLVMEYIDGPSVRSLLDRQGRLPVGDAVHVALHVARALEHVHTRNYVHRDVKPDNILVTPSGVCKLADLGLAKCLSEVSHLSARKQAFGTPYYMSCEQAADATSADARSDLYSLGATLYHLLTGEVPFPGETATEVAEKKLTGKYEPASALNPEVPATLDRIVGLLLAKDPRDRYQTASELILDLVRTNLAPPVPSFVDDAVALADPELRERLESSEPTRPDLQAAESKPSEPPIDPEVWYLRYEEGDGKWCKTKATTAEIVERIRTGKARGTDQVCHRALGAFQPLSEWPVFARALAEREEAVRAERAQSESPPVAPRRWPGYSAIGLAALALVVGAAVLVWLLS